MTDGHLRSGVRQSGGSSVSSLVEHAISGSGDQSLTGYLEAAGIGAVAGAIAAPLAGAVAGKLVSAAEDVGGDSVALLMRANAARDAELQRLTGVRSADRPATVVGAYNVQTGNVVVGQSSKTLQECAEACAVRLDGGDPADIRFTRAGRPRRVGPPFPDVPVCAAFCEPTYGRDAFPDPLTRFQSDGAEVGEEFLP